VLWRCWLGGRRAIRPVKNWVVGCWHGYLSGARCILAYGPADATATLASVKSRLVLPFWYRLTRVVLEKEPLNGSVCACVYRAMLCIRGTSHGPVSVCLSVTSRSSTKMAKCRIIQTTPRDSSGSLIFWRQRSPRNSTGVIPHGGHQMQVGWVRIGDFHMQLSTISWLYLENGTR